MIGCFGQLTYEQCPHPLVAFLVDCDRNFVEHLWRMFAQIPENRFEVATRRAPRLQQPDDFRYPGKSGVVPAIPLLLRVNHRKATRMGDSTRTCSDCPNRTDAACRVGSTEGVDAERQFGIGRRAPSPSAWSDARRVPCRARTVDRCAPARSVRDAESAVRYRGVRPSSVTSNGWRTSGAYTRTVVLVALRLREAVPRPLSAVHSLGGSLAVARTTHQRPVDLRGSSSRRSRG
jgi:hypothetical protein